jgi:hypothetical protein
MTSYKHLSRIIFGLLLIITSQKEGKSQDQGIRRYLIQFTGTMAFDDTVKTYLHFIDDSILLVEQTSIVYYENLNRTESKRYDPTVYYYINRISKKHKLYKVSLRGEITFEGEHTPNTSTKPFDAIYGEYDSTFTREEFLTQSTITDSGNITIVSIPKQEAFHFSRFLFKKREKQTFNTPSLSPLGDSLIGGQKFCYRHEIIATIDPTFFGRKEIVESDYWYPEQEKLFTELMQKINQKNE